MDRVVGITGVDGNCLVFKENFSAKLLTCKSKKMTTIFRYFVINMHYARENDKAFKQHKISTERFIF